MYSTIPTYNSKELNTDTIEILEQIKKQNEEFSTDGSVQLFKNLSNPTNLTNPQIIGTQRTNVTTTKSPSSSCYKKIVPKLKKRKIYRTKTDIDLIRDILFNKQNESKNLIKKEEKNIIFKKNNINYFLDEKTSCLTTKGKVKLKPIWEKIKTPKVSLIKQKDIRINITKKALARNFVDDYKMISQIKYNTDIKREKFERMINIKYSQLSSINNTEEKISKLKDIISKDYNKNYVLYIRFLNNNLEKESQISNELLGDSLKIKSEINKLNNKIIKIIERKCTILKWIGFFIQVKEKLKDIPEFYFDILEENDNYNVYNLGDEIFRNTKFIITDFSHLILKKKNLESQQIKISETTREKLLKYRYNLIFEEPEEIMDHYTNLQSKWLKEIEQRDNLVKEIDSLKQKISNFEESNFIWDEKRLIEKLKLVKNIYHQLKNQYDLLKSQDRKVIKKFCGDELSPKISKINSPDSPDIYDNIYNAMLNNLNFYTVKTNSNKNRINSSFKGAENLINTNLYNLILDLFSTLNQNNFIKFDFSNFIKNSNINPIFEIMNYIELAANFLFQEKYKYLQDPNLKEKYLTIQANFSKENKRYKILKLIKLRQFKLNKQIKEMNEKGKRKKYLTKRKIDYSLYKKLNMNKPKKIQEKNEETKKEEKKIMPNLEAFLEDLK
jgi:hypothetical protein